MLNLNKLQTVFFCLISSVVIFSCTTTKNNSNQSAHKNNYVCPESGTWVNCMPGPDLNQNEYCRADIRDWVMKNCKDVHYAE